MDVFRKEFIVALPEYNASLDGGIEEDEAPDNQYCNQNIQKTEASPLIPNQANTMPTELDGEILQNNAFQLVNTLAQNKAKKIKHANNPFINELESTKQTPPFKKKAGRRKKNSTKKGGHTWKELGNQRSKCITTFMDKVFRLLNNICKKYGYSLEKPNSQILFGKNIKFHRQFISKKLYQILCTQSHNKAIIKVIVKKDKSFKQMVNYKIDYLFEEKYIKIFDGNALNGNNIPSGFNDLCLTKALEDKKKSMNNGIELKKKEINDIEQALESRNEDIINNLQEIDDIQNTLEQKRKEIVEKEKENEEIISSIQSLSLKLIKTIKDENNQGRGGKEPDFIYEVIPEIEY